ILTPFTAKIQRDKLILADVEYFGKCRHVRGFPHRGVVGIHYQTREVRRVTDAGAHLPPPSSRSLSSGGPPAIRSASRSPSGVSATTDSGTKRSPASSTLRCTMAKS